jgi:hypothetical protein
METLQACISIQYYACEVPPFVPPFVKSYHILVGLLQNSTRVVWSVLQFTQSNTARCKDSAETHTDD